MKCGQQGVALITVLLVVAIVTVVCAAMLTRQQVAIRATSNQQQSLQAWHYALGGEALAQVMLARDLKLPGSNPQQPQDHLREAWAQPLPVFQIEQGEIAVHIEDLTGRFNLNSLVQDRQHNGVAIAQFQRLLLLLGITQPYAERLADWLDNNQQTRSKDGAEDTAYLRLKPAYRTADQLFSDPSELRLLLGMSEQDYRHLQPYISTLPPTANLNINTASAVVLCSLSDKLSLQMAQDLIAARGEEGYPSVSAFLAQPALAGLGVQGVGLAVSSQYFQARSKVRLGERHIVLISNIARDRAARTWVTQRNLGQPLSVLARRETSMENQ